MNTRWINERNYKKLSTPFETEEAADAEIEKVIMAVLKLRNKHHILDVHLVMGVNYEDKTKLAKAHMGDSDRAAPMCLASLNDELGVSKVQK